MPDAVLTAETRVRLAGRTLEQARLDAAWQSVRSGGRQVVLLSGEAGIGKTRLVAELTVRAQSGGYPVLVGRCDSTAAAYHPISTWLRTSAHAAALVAAAPPAIQAEVGRLLDELPVDRDDPRPAGPGGERALYSAVAFVVARLAHAGPLLLVIDNAESIDWASSRLLNSLVARLPSGFLLVVSYREPPGGRHPPLLDLVGELSALNQTVRLPLGPIREADIADLVGDLLPSVDAGLAKRLWRHTGGNPFFVRELARSLADSAAEVDPSVWRVPTGVRDVVRHRLRSLSPGVADVLPVAAALGAEVDVELLGQVLHLPEDEVGQALDEAVTVGLLVESGHGWAGIFSFPHPLLRESLAAEVSGARLRGLHLRAARVLMAQPRLAVGGTAAVAAHLRAAGPAAEPIEAAEWSLRAAREAGDLYAWDEAVEYAEAAVDWLAAVPPPTRQAEAAVNAALLRLKSSRGFDAAIGLLETALRRYVAASDQMAAGLVHSRLGGALSLHHSVMNIPRALDHFDAAERLLPSPETVFHLHRGRCQAAMYGLRTDLLQESANRAAAIAEGAGRRDLAVLAGWAQGWAAVNQGRMSDAAAIWQSTWSLAHELADPYLGWMTVNQAALVGNAYLLDPQNARTWCRRGLAQPQFATFSHPHDAVVDQLSLGLALMGELPAARDAADALPGDAVARRMLTFLSGDWEGAEQSWAAAAAADESAGDRHDAALNLRWLAMARRHLGRPLEQVVDPLQTALEFSTDRRQVPTELAVRAELAELLASDQPGEAAGHLDRCETILSDGQDWRGLVATVELARAALAATHGDEAGSDARRSAAVDVFTRFRLPWHAAAALTNSAESLARRGAPNAAERHRARAHQLYATVGAADRWRDRTSTTLPRGFHNGRAG